MLSLCLIEISVVYSCTFMFWESISDLYSCALTLSDRYISRYQLFWDSISDLYSCALTLSDSNISRLQLFFHVLRSVQLCSHSSDSNISLLRSVQPLSDSNIGFVCMYNYSLITISVLYVMYTQPDLYSCTIPLFDSNTSCWKLYNFSLTAIPVLYVWTINL